MSGSIITLLTDYGVGTQHVGALHAVLARECPAADRIDLAHDIPPGDIRWAAILLARLIPELPGAVHLAVVDPGVGTERRGVAIALEDGSHVVGPDNGLLGLLVRMVDAAVRLPIDDELPATFHGRDVFAPVAARLSRGEPLAAVGSAIPVNSIAAPTIPVASVRPGRIGALVVGADRFGNLALAAGAQDLIDADLSIGDPLSVAGRPAVLGRTFGDVASGETLVYIDSNEMLSIAIRDGNAAAVLAVESGATLLISSAHAGA